MRKNREERKKERQREKKKEGERRRERERKRKKERENVTENNNSLKKTTFVLHIILCEYHNSSILDRFKNSFPLSVLVAPPFVLFPSTIHLIHLSLFFTEGLGVIQTLFSHHIAPHYSDWKKSVGFNHISSNLKPNISYATIQFHHHIRTSVKYIYFLLLSR